jgi:PAS domain S-box-containing protein
MHRPNAAGGSFCGGRPMIRKGKTTTEKETIQITPSLLHSTKSVLLNKCSAWIVLMVGLMITAAVFLYMKSSVERIADLEFISQCNEISNKISDRLYDHSLLLLSGAALFKASETVTREEWHIFTRHQKIEKTLPGIQGIGFSLLIPRKELTRHIQKIRHEGFPHYKLRPDGDRKVYSSIIYLEPFSGRNLQAFGYDMLSEPVRRSAMERARDTGAAALSGKVILVQETDEAVQAGTLMYMPVYQNGIPIETVEKRRAAIYGWVYSPYRMNDLIHGIFGGINQEKEKQMHLQVFDGAQLSSESLLYDSYSTRDKKFRPDARFTRQVPVDFNGQLWTLRFTRTGDGFFTVDYISVWITLVGGLFITLLLFTLTITLLNTVAKERLAANLAAELRASDEKYRNLFENANEAIFVVQNRKLVFLNPMTAMITGYSGEKLMAKPFAEFIHPDDRDMVIDRHIRRMEGEELPPVYSFRIIHKDGNIIWVELNAVLISWNGETATLNFLSDITGRKQMEEEKRNLEERLNRAEKMESLGILAGGVAHDLNNVLGIVVGYAEMLLMGTDKSSPVRSKLVNIMEAGQKAATIVGDLLTLARRGVSGRDVVNLNKIIADLRQSPEFEKLSSYNSAVKIKTDLDPDLLNISASSVHLNKTLFNLVSNASEAMKKGGCVTIKTFNRYLDKPIHGYDKIQEGDYVILSVSDTGEGINADDIKRIFEPFYTKKVMGRSGTGLGLAVVWGTVKDHNGYINVESEEGKGSTFTLYFPVTREELSAESLAVSVSEYTGKGESVLVVDDVKEQRNLAEEMLRKLNYTVTSISSGEEALLYFKDHKVDLMILDMIMDPGMDGLDTYRRVLEIHPQQKAIIVSGFSESDRVKSAQSLGAGAYVRKPYVIEKLGLAVKKELDRAV